MSHERAFSYRFINGNVIQRTGSTSRYWSFKLRCNVRTSGSSFIDGNRPTAQHIELVDQCALQDIDTGLHLSRLEGVPPARQTFTCALLHLKAKVPSFREGHNGTHLPFIEYDISKYHVHCQFSHTSNNQTASNGLCHKTARAKNPQRSADFVWVQLREQPGRP